MNIRIRKAAVLGAGVMGSGIAAHLANAGIPVVLLDIVPPAGMPGATGRDHFARAALAQLKKQQPAPLMTERALALIEPGNLEDHLAKVGECDWVVEVIKEDLKLKNALFARLEPLVGPHTIVSSNTSGMSIAGMTEGRGDAFKRRFLVTHFFNPVRYMKLLELVPGQHTDPALLRDFAAFGERVLGKGIVFAKDTTNFIGNRIGTYGMMRTLHLMQEQGFTVEEVDALFGPALGRPKSAVFRTADLVGLDTFLHVTTNCYDSLTSDEARDTFKPPAFLTTLVEKKMLGDKTGGGFYKKVRGEGGASEIQALDLATLTYRPQKKVRFASTGAARDAEGLADKVRALLFFDDQAARFALQVTLDTLAYTSRRLGDISDDLVNIDRAMRWGYAWDVGPFELWDILGVQEGLARMKALGLKPAPWVESMVAQGRTSFYDWEGTTQTYFDVKATRPQPVPVDARTITLEVLRRGNKKVEGNDSASLWDVGDGVLLCEFHSKMNAIDDQVTEALEHAVSRAEAGFRGIVVGNDGANFSVGANLASLLWTVKSIPDGGASWDDVRRVIRRFQAVNQRLRYCEVPVVTAPFGMVLGGGAEVAMAGNAIQAAAETYMGLVEVGVGLIPGGGGNLQLLRNLFGPHAGNRDFDPLPFLKKAFLAIGTAKVATSAEQAREAGFLNPGDGISMNRDHLLADAKARCIGLAESGFRPPLPATFFLPGKSGFATIDMLLFDMQGNHQISPYDRHVGQALARVLSGGDTSALAPVTEQHLLDLELEAFLSLLGEARTQDRMAHMLETGKPLRN